MNKFLTGLRSAIISDTYLSSKLTKEQIHLRHVSEVAKSPLLPAITFRISQTPQQSAWNVYIRWYLVQIDIWGRTGYKEILSLYEDDSSAVKNSFGSVRGLRALLHGQRLRFDGGMIAYFQETDAFKRFDPETNVFNIVTRYKVFVRDPDAAQIKSWVKS